MPDSGLEVTHDAALGGRLRLTQPKRGHRFGHDAILLAAAVPAKAGDRVADLGAGVGAAGLAVAARVPGIDLTLVEIEPALVALVKQNIAANGFSQNARAVTLDATAMENDFAAVGLPAGSFDCVLMNPPFNDATLQPSPDALRRRAHVSASDTLMRWIASAERLLRHGGTLTLIGRGADADQIVASLAGWGAITLLPIRSIEDQPPIRAICRATKGGGGAPVTLPDFILNDVARMETAAARRVLRDAAPLPLAAQ
jgi:tRNA1(Val) A37 N6-methylase TrmN6